MVFTNFVGPSYRARSPAIAAEDLINLYTEATETQGPAKTHTFYGTPGLSRLLTVGTNSCRGWFAQDGRTFTVVGDQLYAVDLFARTATPLGTIVDDSLPVSFASNGRGGEQLAIVGGGQLKILTLTTSVLSAAVVLPLTNPPVVIDFINGYFVLLEKNTVRVWFSALENGLLWDALDVFAVSVFSCNLVGLKVLRDRIWLFGSQATVIYYDSGDADNPFVPYPGSVMQEGLGSPYGVTIQGESVFWLAQDNLGQHRMVMASDYAPTVISTPAISFAVASYPTVTDVEVLTYEQEGHPFVAWTFPQGETLVYDVREQEWHKRDTWNPTQGVGGRWRVRGCCAAGGRILCGDYLTGALYALDLDTFTDDDVPIRRLRRTPYLSAENQWLFVDRFELGIQAGIGTSGQGVAPQVLFRLSRDRAQTWTPPLAASLGAQGAFVTRAVWRTLGRVRADRLVCETTMTDPVRCVWGPGAWIRARPGSGQN